MPGKYLYKQEPPHPCETPSEVCFGDIWQCDCGQVWQGGFNWIGRPKLEFYRISDVEARAILEERRKSENEKLDQLP